MANRRAFLTSLGVGLGGLGLPGIAQAFGRRRHSVSCSPCPPCPSGPPLSSHHVREQVVALHKVCPISRSQFNGIWYYGALDCYYSPPHSTSFSSSTFIDPLATNCSSGSPPCQYFSLFMSPTSTAPKTADEVLPHHILGKPSLKKLLDPSTDMLKADVGTATECYHQDFILRMSDDRRPRVRLMLILMTAPKEAGGGIAVLPVGQEISGTGKLDQLSTESESDAVVTVRHGLHLFYVVLVNPDMPKK